MNRTANLHGNRAVALALAVLIALFGSALLMPAHPANAAPRVDINGTPSADGESQLQLSGSGFQSVKGGFGGIYVFFGWVDDPQSGSWKPSQGGVTGGNYRYVHDDENNPVGFQLFVAFPGSTTQAVANGGEVAPDGTWSGTIRIPGAVFDTFDRDQNATRVDCRQVQCGIITVGAHGVKNANNETFTPVNFAAGAEPAAPAQPVESAAPEPAQNGATTAPAQNENPNASPAPMPASPPISEEEPAVNEPAAMQPLVPEWLFWFIPVFSLLALSILALAVGIGAYLAAKSLLLGVNPAALERERAKRERDAMRERARQRARTERLGQRLGAKEAKVERKEQAAAPEPHGTGLLQDEGANGLRDEDAVLNFFRTDEDVPSDVVDRPRSGSTAFVADDDSRDGEPTVSLPAGADEEEERA